MSNPNDYRLEDQIGFKLRLANQKHLEVFSRLMPDVTPTQFAVLAKLNETGSISQNHLGRLVGMDAATTKGVVDRLKKKGFLVSAQSHDQLAFRADYASISTHILRNLSNSFNDCFASTL